MTSGYIVTAADGQLPSLELPIEVSLTDAITARLEAGDLDSWSLWLKHRVDPLDLQLIEDPHQRRLLPDGRDEPLPLLKIKDAPAEDGWAWDLLAAISFVTDRTFRVSARHEPPVFVAEGEEDTAALTALGTNLGWRPTELLLASRSFAEPPVDAQRLAMLLPRRAGLRLYADAIALPTDVARFRELWRVLESALGVDDTRLVKSLARYPPALEMKFTAEELDRMYVLRGQVSHAATRTGMEELMRAGSQASAKLGRLKNLVERVILTKASWGTPTLGVDELLPMNSYIDPDGSQQVRLI